MFFAIFEIVKIKMLDSRESGKCMSINKCFNKRTRMILQKFLTNAIMRSQKCFEENNKRKYSSIECASKIL